jgi:macrolide-specific efflux system membrane fusion protein
VPFSAVRRAADGSASVRVLATDGGVENRRVELGLSNRVSAQILSGLEPGERVAADRPQAGTGAREASAARTPKMGPRL